MRTCRRQLLDEFLANVEPLFVGVVLDIGGKKNGKRGFFRPPIDRVDDWLYLNIDSANEPDIVARAEELPLHDASVDTFILCEVLEYLGAPEQALAEASRILKPGGHGTITIPFLHPIHPDPWDLQRWTDTRIKRVLLSVGLELLELRPMGGTFAVLTDIVQIRLGELPKSARFRRSAGFALLALVKRIFAPMIRKAHPRITTGFGVVVRKTCSDESKPLL